MSKKKLDWPQLIHATYDQHGHFVVAEGDEVDVLILASRGDEPTDVATYELKSVRRLRIKAVTEEARDEL